MRHWIGLFLFIATCTSLLPALAEEPRGDLQAIQGTWDVERLTIDGRTVLTKGGAGFKYVLEGDQLCYHFVMNGKPHQVDFAISLDESATPKGINARLLTGAFKAKVCRGIFEHEGDKLTICLPDNPSRARPQEFKSTTGSVLHLVSLRRSKP